MCIRDRDKTEDTKDKTTAASGIVCWGDDLINGEESNTYSYMTVLQDVYKRQIVDKLDKVGYHAVECWGGATFDASLRFLHEDPWERCV